MPASLQFAGLEPGFETQDVHIHLSNDLHSVRVGPSTPTTHLSCPGDGFELPRNPYHGKSFSKSAARRTVTIAGELKTPGEEIAEPDWSTPTNLSHKSSTSSLASSTSTVTSPTSPELEPSPCPQPAYPQCPPLLNSIGVSDTRLPRASESTPSILSTKPPQVPQGWRVNRPPPMRQSLCAPRMCQHEGEASSPLARASKRESYDPHQNRQGQQVSTPSAKKVRRTQSMFPSAQQFIVQEMAAPACPESPGKLGRGEIPVFKVAQDAFPRIPRDVLVQLLDGQYRHMYERVVVVDCRFEYEYEGGHIAGAINVSSKEALEKRMIEKVYEITERKSTLVVFHCEYSAYRGPLMATHLRQCDRQANIRNYPNLYYPDIAVLDGGYSHFYQAHNDRCEPRNYVGMNDHGYQSTCEKEMDRFRAHMRMRKSNASLGSLVDVQTSAPKFRFPVCELRMEGQ